MPYPIEPLPDSILIPACEILSKSIAEDLPSREIVVKLYTAISILKQRDAERNKPDSQVIEELHLFVTALWARERQKPVSRANIEKFLLLRVPARKLDRVLKLALDANIIAQVAGENDLFIPRPKHTHAELP